jgi:cobalt-zinc-cadmium efflux system outer membrane protein
MRIGTTSVVVCVAVLAHAGIAGAQHRSMTLADVLARAREQAPQIAAARLALEETRGHLAGASLRLQQNPEIEAAVGSRRAADSRFTDFDITLGQAFEPAARRSARIAGAQAAVDQRAADIDETTRVVLRAAAGAYYRVAHANERLRLLAATEDLAARLYSTADRRFQAGDIAVLDVNLARGSLARVRAERQAAEAARIVAVGELSLVLRMNDGIEVDGGLSLPPAADLATAIAAASGRPELRALAAGVREAEEEARLGGTFSTPDFGLGVTYSREAGDHIVLAGLKVTLPLFAQGQEARAVGTARAARLRFELDAARARIRLEVRSAFDAWGARAAAVRVLETEALPGLDENETLTARSFEVGQIGLPELLLIRREILDTRAQYLDALVEAALARVDLDAAAALLR